MAIAIKCKHCGAMLVPIPQPSAPAQPVSPSAAGPRLIYPRNPPYDPTLITILSTLLWTGLGQIVLGQVAKGCVMVVGSGALACCTCGVSLLVTWPLGAIDAYRVATKLREGRPVGEWEFF
jgi:TM2 domain-containing membrane protein YozV